MYTLPSTPCSCMTMLPNTALKSLSSLLITQQCKPSVSQWYHDNESLNISKMKEMIADYRNSQDGVHQWSCCEKSQEHQVSLCLRSAHQQLYFLQKLNKFGLNPKTLTSFYHCTTESILTGCIAVWYGSCSAHNSKALQRAVKTAELWVTDNKLPAIYQSQCLR